MKQRLEEINFLEVTTAMLPYGIPFPVVPESPEVMNIIIPEMLQNALTESMTVEEAANDAAERINELIASRFDYARRRAWQPPAGWSLPGRRGIGPREDGSSVGLWPPSRMRQRSMLPRSAARDRCRPGTRVARPPHRQALGRLSLHSSVAAGDAARHRLPARLHRLALVPRHAAAHRGVGLQRRRRTTRIS